MEFTIYTFGDVEIFRAALAGVAMVFNADGYFVSNDGVGLGALAGLGILIGLVGMLFEGVMRQRFALGEFLMLIIVFVVLFVPKFSVNVEDYNGAAIAKVDNVPLGVALPAGLISGLANEMNKKMATAFSTVYGYPSGMMTPQALVGPLKLLQSLSATGPVMNDYEPRLGMNIRNLMAYCIAGRAGQANRWARIRIGEDPIPKMVTEAGTQSGWALYVDLGGNEGMRTCSAASSQVLDDLNTFMSASGPTATINSVLTAAAARNSAATVQIANNTPYVLPVDVEQQKTALSMLAQTEAELAVNLVRSAIFTPDISAAMACSGQSPLPEDWAKCMPFQEATLKFNVDAAAAGSFFQRLMTGGMNVLFFVWICLSPVVAVVMLMKGITGLKLAGSYLFFGAWAVSWYVGASIINFYMLKQVQYEVAMLGGIANLTPGTLAQFLAPGGILATKIAIAGDMMASVPILMMSIMGGSMYAMTRVADRWSGRDYYDESRQAPGVSESKPLYGRESMKQASYYKELGIGPRQGFMTPGEIQVQDSLGNAITDATTSATEWSNARSASISNSLGTTFQSGEMARSGGAITNGLKSIGATGLASISNIAKELAERNDVGENEKRNIMDGINFRAGLSLGGSGAGADWAVGRIRELGIGRNESQTLKELESGSKEFKAQIASEVGRQNMDEIAKIGSHMNSDEAKQTWQNTQQVMSKAAQAHQTEEALRHTAGTFRSIDLERLARQIEANPQQREGLAIKRHAEELREDNMFQSLVPAKRSALAETSIGDMSPNTLTRVAELQAMAAIRPAAFASTLAELTGSPAITVGDGQHQSVDTSGVKAEGALHGPETGAREQAAGLIARNQATVASGDGAVQRHHERQSADVRDRQPTQRPDTSHIKPTHEKFKNDEMSDGVAKGAAKNAGEWARGEKPFDYASKAIKPAGPKTEPQGPRLPPESLVKDVPTK
jgi:conjugal transfer mating pair stabilization protein TraG